MANLSTLVDKLADKQADIYQILKSLVDVAYQHERAIGDNTNQASLDAINAKIDAGMVSIDKGMIDAMAATPFDTQAEPPVT